MIDKRFTLFSAIHILLWQGGRLLMLRRCNGDVFNAEPDKCDELRWCASDALPNNTIPYVRRAIANVAQGI
jgi:hypothetical protein